jgi:hypothetical protein
MESPCVWGPSRRISDESHDHQQLPAGLHKVASPDRSGAARSPLHQVVVVARIYLQTYNITFFIFLELGYVIHDDMLQVGEEMESSFMMYDILELGPRFT